MHIVYGFYYKMCCVDSTVSEYSTRQVLPGTAPPSRSCSTSTSTVRGEKQNMQHYRVTRVTTVYTPYEYTKILHDSIFSTDGADKNGARSAPSSVLPSLQCKHNHDQIRSSPVQSTWQSNPLLYAVGQLHIVISPRQSLTVRYSRTPALPTLCVSPWQ